MYKYSFEYSVSKLRISLSREGAKKRFLAISVPKMGYSDLTMAFTGYIYIYIYICNNIYVCIMYGGCFRPSQF